MHQNNFIKNIFKTKKILIFIVLILAAAGQNFNTVQALVSTGSKADGSLIRYESSPKVYVLQNGRKRWIKTEETFIGLGYDWKKILIVPQSEIYEDGVDMEVIMGARPDGTLIRYASSPKVYILENNRKCWIFDPATFIKLGYKWKNILIIPETENYVSGETKTGKFEL